MTTRPRTKDFLAATPVFTSAEFRASLPGGVTASTAHNRLRQALVAGQVERVAQGLYVSRVGVFRERTPDPLLVASKLAPDAAVAFHSALEAHGVAHSPFRRVTVVSRSVPRTLTYGGFEFRRLPAPMPLRERGAADRFTTLLRRDDALVRVTTRERTLVDCVGDLRWSGGLEELLRSVGGFTSVDPAAALDYLDLLRSPSLVARTAWVLFSGPELWRLTEEERAAFRERLGAGPYYLERGRGPMVFVPEWRLYVAADADAREWLRG